MSFIIREATVEDVPSIFILIKELRKEFKIEGEPFKITEDKITTDAFEGTPKIYFIVAEFKGQLLGYCAYFFSYDVFNGPSIIVEDFFVKKDFRKMGISVYLFSKLIDLTIDKKNHLLRWLVDFSNKKIILLLKELGVSIDEDYLIMNIHQENFTKLVNIEPKTNYKIRFAIGLDLPDIFAMIKEFAKEQDVKLESNIYKLMADGFSTNPQFKILVAVDAEDRVVGFLSFIEAYSTYNGKALIVDKRFIEPKYRGKKITYDLIKGLIHYANDNNYERVEYGISKFNVEKIENFKEMNIFPYGNLRIASFVKDNYKKLL